MGLMRSLFVIKHLYLSGGMARIVDENGHRHDMCYDEACICDIDTIV